MRKQIFILWLICISVLLGCKKKDPVETTEASVFSFTGNINGNYVSYSSGINDYYMFSSYNTDVNNVREFSGELKLKNCSGICSNSLKIKIKNYRDLSGPTTSIDSLINNSYYAYSIPTGNAAAYSVTLIPQFVGGTPQTYSWTFHDGNTSAASSPIKIYNKSGKYSVSLSIQSTALCTSTLSNIIKIGQTGNEVESNFTVSTPTGNVLSFTAQPVLGTPPYSYNWDFGDGNTSTLANPTHTYSTNGVYLTSLTVTDANNNSATYQNNINTQSPGTCLTRFTYVKSAIANPFNLSNVIVEWTDSNGIVYTSENNTQPSTSGFQITSVEEYLINENGQKTKKINGVLNCTLYNGTNSVILDKANFTFALAYP